MSDKKTAEEIFKDIKGYEGCYQISNLGNVKSLSRTYKSGHNTIKETQEKLLSKILNKKTGYHTVVLQGKRHTIHRLVLGSFISNRENKRCVNHINGIKTDNRVENLEWNTYSENMQHSLKTGLRKHSYDR